MSELDSVKNSVEASTEQSKDNQLSVFQLLAQFVHYASSRKYWLLSFLLVALIVGFVFGFGRRSFIYTMTADTARGGILTPGQLALILSSMPSTQVPDSFSVVTLLADARLDSYKGQRTGPFAGEESLVKITVTLKDSVNSSELTREVKSYIDSLHFVKEGMRSRIHSLKAMLEQSDSLLAQVKRNLLSINRLRQQATVYVENAGESSGISPVWDLFKQQQNIVEQLERIESFKIITPFGKPETARAKRIGLVTISTFLLLFLMLGCVDGVRFLYHLKK